MSKAFKYKPKDQFVDPRFKMQNSSESIPSIYEALVELITNIDDSEERKARKSGKKEYRGKAIIEHQRGEKNTWFAIKDSAEGMSYEDIELNFGNYGTYQAGGAGRGFAGRGAKDIVCIGTMDIESIKNKKYSYVKLYNRRKNSFQPIEKNIKVNPKLRKKIGAKMDGSRIYFEFDPTDGKSRYNTQSSSLIKRLPNHYALRDILDKDNGTLKLLYDFKNKRNEKNVQLNHIKPSSTLVHEDEFYIDEYKRFGEDAKVSFKLYKSPVSLETDDSNDPRFRQYGIFIKSKKAVHYNTLFNPQLEKAKESKFYYGVIKTSLINALLDEYEKISQDDDEVNLPDDNPTSILDLRRLTGLALKHPAVELIYKKPRKYLNDLINEEIRKNRSDSLEDEDTKNLNKEISEICSKLMKDVLDEPDLDEEGIPVNKWIFKPPKHKLHEDDSRVIYLFTRPESLKSGNNHAEIKIRNEDSEYISAENDTSEYHHSKKNDKYIFFKFKLNALKNKKGITVEAYHGGSIKTTVVIDIEPVKNRDFVKNLEFKKSMNICTIDDITKKGKSKQVTVYAKVPELIDTPTKGSIFLSDNDIAIVPNEVTFKPYKDSNYAIANIKVHGKKVGLTKINVNLNDEYASSDIKVSYLDEEDKEDEDKGKLKITIEPRDFGETRRAEWNFKDPSHLQIAGEHPTVKRYLGKKGEKYPGQKSHLYKILQAEIIAEYMVMKYVQDESFKTPEKYTFVQTEEPSVSVDRLNINLVYLKDQYLKLIHEVSVRQNIIEGEISKIK